MSKDGDLAKQALDGIIDSAFRTLGQARGDNMRIKSGVKDRAVAVLDWYSRFPEDGGNINSRAARESKLHRWIVRAFQTKESEPIHLEILEWHFEKDEGGQFRSIWKAPVSDLKARAVMRDMISDFIRAQAA